MDHPKPKPPTVKLTPILPKKPEPKQVKTPKRPDRKEHLTTNPFKNLRNDLIEEPRPRYLGEQPRSFKKEGK